MYTKYIRMTDRYVRMVEKGKGSPLKVRQGNENEDLLIDWAKPSQRTEEEKRVYGPKLVKEKLALLREFNKNIHKKPGLLTEVRDDLAKREAEHPEMSRFKLRLDVIHHQMKNNKKLGMKTKYYKSPGIGLYELFKGRKITDSIFGNDLVANEIEKYSRGQGIVDTPVSLQLSPAKTKKALKPKKKSASPPKTTKTEKRKRCPNGTRRNKKTGKCEPKK